MPFSAIFIDVPRVSVPSYVLLSKLSRSSRPAPAAVPGDDGTVLGGSYGVIIFVEFEVCIGGERLLFKGLGGMPSHLGSLRYIA